MADWTIKRTETFLKQIKQFRKNKFLLQVLDKKIERLKEAPESVGGELAGKLSGNRSTRLIRKFRLIFKINSEEGTVYLMAIDHREDIY